MESAPGGRRLPSREVFPLKEVTQILRRIEAGDAGASAELLPIVYSELRRLAAARLSQERCDHSLEPTALVHEAYLRLVDVPVGQKWQNRGHFFAAAAEAMRRILVEHARRELRRTRSLKRTRIDLETIEPAARDSNERIVAVDEVLTRFAALHPEKAELVKLRFFAGMTLADAASALGISTATADRHWKYARAWLCREMQRLDSDDF